MEALPTKRTWPPSCSHGTYQHKAITSRSRQLLMMGTFFFIIFIGMLHYIILSNTTCYLHWIYSGYFYIDRLQWLFLLHGLLLIFTILIAVYVCWYFHWLFFLYSVLSSFILSIVFVNSANALWCFLISISFFMGTWLPETCWATIRREIKNTKSTI